MKEKLKNIILDIKSQPGIRNDSILISQIIRIEKISKNEMDTAYLIGLFIWNRVRDRTVSNDYRMTLFKEFQTLKLDAYFSLKKPPELDELALFEISLFIAGIGFLIHAIIMFYKGITTVGVSSRFLHPTIHTGGTSIIIGLILIYGTSYKMYLSLKRRRLIQMLNHKTNNINDNNVD